MSCRNKARRQARIAAGGLPSGTVLPMSEQKRRATENAAAHQARYPHPPVYSYDGEAVVQPWCYVRQYRIRGRKR